MLHYAGDDQWSYEEDAYNPANFGETVKRWIDATGGPTFVTRCEPGYPAAGARSWRATRCARRRSSAQAFGRSPYPGLAMCGVSGFWGPRDLALLEAMTAAQAHRGPDDLGFSRPTPPASASAASASSTSSAATSR